MTETLNTNDLQRQHEWLLLGVAEKEKSVVTLASGPGMQTVLEVGCGTGAVLEHLDRQGFAREYYAIEPSPERYGFMIERRAIGRLVAAEPATLRECSFRGRTFDLVILSHVLEHIEDPARLLSDALEIGNLVLVEVPLEGNTMGNLRAAIRSRLTGVPRHDNAAGHIQFYDRSDLHSLARWCGGEVVRSRAYAPRAQWRQSIKSGSIPRRSYTATVLGLSWICGEERWARIYHGHYATLIRRRSALSARERTRWPAANYYEDRGALPAAVSS